MKRSLIVALASATIALGTVASASAAPANLEDPALAAPSAGGSSGSSDFFNPHDGQNSGSTDIANGFSTAGLNTLCVLFVGKPWPSCMDGVVL